MTWHDYVDESYNHRTLCVGGFLAPWKTWEEIEAKWKRRIDYENRLSSMGGFPPISRYHATDCAGLHREFSRKNGWSIPRQISLTKRLCHIIGSSNVRGIVIGGSVDGFRLRFPQDADFNKGLYRLSFMMHLIVVGQLMHEFYPNERVTVYFDRSRDFGPIAQQAFDAFMKDRGVAHLSRYFVTISAMGWEDCVALQPADFIAYEGMKRLDGSLVGNDKVRKSLQSLIGAEIPLTIQGYSDDTYQAMLQITNNGAPEEGSTGMNVLV